MLITLSFVALSMVGFTLNLMDYVEVRDSIKSLSNLSNLQSDITILFTSTIMCVSDLISEWEYKGEKVWLESRERLQQALN